MGICLSAGKGGLELYAHKAIHALQQAGHDCHFALTPDSFLAQHDWRMPLLELTPGFRHFPYLTARRLAHYIDAHKIDILHMHWNKDLNLVALAKALSRRKPKLVYSRHMEITRSKKDVYHKLLYRQVDKMLVNAEFVQKQAERFLPLQQEQINLLYLGVEASARATSAECEEMLSSIYNKDNNFVIGMIGRIESYKGQHVLIDALAAMRQDKQNVQVVMAGPIMDKAYYEKLNQQIQAKGLSEHVKYLGIIREPSHLMSCCDVVVLATVCETFGLVLVEAMRAGTAVVGTNAGGVPEIIKHNATGLLYEPGNARQLAACLSELQNDTAKRENLAQAGKSYAERMFDEKQHLARLESIFATLCGERA